MTDGDHFSDDENATEYKETELQMGIKPIKLTNVNISPDISGEIFVYGKNFTSSCQIYINDRAIDTKFIDDSTLLIQDVSLENGDEIALKLLDSKDLDFCELDSFTYLEDDLENRSVKSKKKDKKKKKSKNSIKK